MRREERLRSVQQLVCWTHSPTGCTDGARETEEETGTRCCWQPSQSERTGDVWAWPAEGVGVARESPRPRGDGAVTLLSKH